MSESEDIPPFFRTECNSKLYSKTYKGVDPIQDNWLIDPTSFDEFVANMDFLVDRLNRLLDDLTAVFDFDWFSSEVAPIIELGDPANCAWYFVNDHWMCLRYAMQSIVAKFEMISVASGNELLNQRVNALKQKIEDYSNLKEPDSSVVSNPTKKVQKWATGVHKQGVSIRTDIHFVHAISNHLLSTTLMKTEDASDAGDNKQSPTKKQGRPLAELEYYEWEDKVYLSWEVFETSDGSRKTYDKFAESTTLVENRFEARRCVDNVRKRGGTIETLRELFQDWEGRGRPSIQKYLESTGKDNELGIQKAVEWGSKGFWEEEF